MDKLSFSYNWNNKLDNDCFTTLRLRNDLRYHLGDKMEAELNGVSKGMVYFEDIKHLKLDSINEFVARLDTGYCREKCIEIIKTMYKNKNINWNVQQLSLILCVKIK